MKFTLTILCCLLFLACSRDQSLKVEFLQGTWKVEGTEQYEVWKLTDGNNLAGYSYKLEDGQERVTETLSISRTNGNLVYSATVPNQNEGRTIAFGLNPNIDDYLSFENPVHDFPKKIQYKIISDDIIDVIVLGGNEEGFSYRMGKQSHVDF